MASKEFQKFIYQGQVRGLFRKFLREIRDLQQPDRGEMQKHIRDQFDNKRGVADLLTVRHLIGDGAQQLKQMKDMLNLKR